MELTGSINKEKIDWSVYLVTDSDLLSPSAKSFEDHVAQTIEGGVGIVQLREKTLSTGDFVKKGKQLRKFTREKGIPLIINDRVDVALAVDADGVHVGQDDMDVKTARKLIGNSKILGASVSTVHEAKIAIEEGADYLGISAVYTTPTKALTSPPCGVRGVRDIVKYVAKNAPHIKTVAIGGLNATNIARVRYQSETPFINAKLDGVAVVSALMAASDPLAAAKHLKETFQTLPTFIAQQHRLEPEQLKGLISIYSPLYPILEAIRKQTPLIHHLTNDVVKNFSANVTLAIGASPIMSHALGDIPPLARLPVPHAAVLNIGTLTTDLMDSYLETLNEYNQSGWPIILDPVGAGATEFRAQAIVEFLDKGYVDVIKGNLGEIMAVAGWQGGQSRGVDSIDAGNLDDRCRLAEFLARRERNIVVVTGKDDVISDGFDTIIVSNGNALLGKITGSGCALGSVIAACLAVDKSRKLLACVGGVLLYDIASEIAARKEEVRGPGTFLPAFIDALNELSGGFYPRIQNFGKISIWKPS